MKFEIPNIPDPVVITTLLLAAAAVFLFYYMAARKATLIPNPLQNLAEMVIDFFRGITLELMGKEGDVWLPFVVTLFSFILVCNLFSFVPGAVPPTAKLSVPAGLMVMVFILVQVVGIRRNGVFGYIKSFVPHGVPKIMIPFMFPLEIASMLGRFFALALRLFLSVMVGHGILSMIIGLALVLRFFLVPLPVVGGAMFMGFELFIAALQAYLFSFLAVMYLSMATSHE